eukprot:1132858-Rhodomonas_salina.1
MASRVLCALDPHACRAMSTGCQAGFTLIMMDQRLSLRLMRAGHSESVTLSQSYALKPLTESGLDSTSRLGRNLLQV